MVLQNFLGVALMEALGGRVASPGGALMEAQVLREVIIHFLVVCTACSITTTSNVQSQMLLDISFTDSS